MKAVSVGYGTVVPFAPSSSHTRTRFPSQSRYSSLIVSRAGESCSGCTGSLAFALPLSSTRPPVLRETPTARAMVRTPRPFWDKVRIARRRCSSSKALLHHGAQVGKRPLGLRPSLCQLRRLGDVLVPFPPKKPSPHPPADRTDRREVAPQCVGRRDRDRRGGGLGPLARRQGQKRQRDEKV